MDKKNKMDTKSNKQEQTSAPVKKKKIDIYLTNKQLLPEVIESKNKGEMSDTLARMLIKLVKRYSERHNFANYTYIEDMRGYALMELMRSWHAFDPNIGSNPFAFFTQCIKRSFYQYLNKEKKQRDIRDALLVENGMTPSFKFQMEYQEELESGLVDQDNQSDDNDDDGN